jgi:hypothetical protein
MRRLFWVSVGAGLGISGYRRASHVLRELGGQPRSRRLRLRPTLRQVRGVTGFARDVREGMDLYAERQRLSAEPHQAPEGPTLGWQHVNGAGAAGNASHNGASAH